VRRSGCQVFQFVEEAPPLRLGGPGRARAASRFPGRRTLTRSAMANLSAMAIPGPVTSLVT
jgi:hypothetical protein